VLIDDGTVSAVYEIVVKGELGATVACAFEGMRLELRAGETAIVGPVADQAELTGLLRQVTDLGLDLISVERVSDGPGGAPAANGLPATERRNARE
jgi:hypothetical protein